ncbi:retrovirus-related pol polyprotein from transposon TNT 1-94 [Tanacetum coccineum]|uniref:Retrovirus-related pol polyprotein from transposon TNT 1-94 n=1 Tax=Tanacetum coccineum TaxID=301880 RepID=A0ABQ4X6X3_9ASTR
MTTLAELMIVAGAENRLPMLDKAMYNSWERRMLLYIKGKKNGRMMLESIENGPLVYPTVEVDGQIRKKKYIELVEQEQLQDDYDVQATNIVLQDLPPDVYTLVNHCQSAKDIWERVKLLMKGTKLSYQEREFSQQPSVKFLQMESKLVVLVFLLADDLISCLNKAMEFMSTVVVSHFPSINNQLITSSNPQNQATIQYGRVTVQQVQRIQGQSSSLGTIGNATTLRGNNAAGQAREKLMLAKAHESGQVLDKEKLAFLADLGITDCHDVQPIIIHKAAFQTDDLDTYDSNCDDISSAKSVLMANLSSYGSDVLSEIPKPNTYQNNNMLNQSVQETQYFEQSLIDYVPDNEITNVINIVMRVDSVLAKVLLVDTKCPVNDNLEIEILEQEYDHFFEILLSQDIVHICVNYLASWNDCREMQQGFIDEYNENLMLKAELAKKGQMVEKSIFDEVVLRCSRLENCNVNLELKLKHQKESFLNNKPLNNQNAPEIPEFFEINEWQARLDAKDVSIANLRKHIEKLKGKNVLAPKLLNKKDAHIYYIKHSWEHADILREIVEYARALRPLDSDLDSACKIVQRIQEVLVYVKNTCPRLTKPSEKLVAVTPLNKNKKFMFAEVATSSSTTQKQADSYKTQDFNKPMLPSTGMKSFTSTSRSRPLGNTKNNRILRSTSSNMKNKVKDHPRSVKSMSNKMNHVIEPVRNAHVKHTMLNTNSELICVKCNQCMFDANHDVCFLEFFNYVNVRSKSKSAKKSKNKSIWKPTSKVFTDIGYRWKPTGTIRFKNDQIAKIMGYGDYQIGNVMISRVYNVERLGYNLFSVGQFCDSDLEVAFCKHTYYIRDLEEAVRTACFTQNISLIRKRHNRKPYELLHNKKPDLSYFYVFGALCYPTNDSKDLGKFKPKADSYMCIGYSLKGKNEAKPDKTEHGFGKSVKN